VIIVDGARYRGAVDMGDMEAPRASGPLPARTEKALVRSTTAATRPALPPARRPSPVAPSAPVRKAEPAAPAHAPVLATAKKIKKKVVVKKKVEE
jgi:hypothetical protein